MDFELGISASAIKRIRHLKTREKAANLYLRISVESGGCSGLQYNFEFVAAPEQDDKVITQEDVALLIDDVSQQFLHGSIVDYLEDLGNASFVIRNPNASAKCGCGNSFAT